VLGLQAEQKARLSAGGRATESANGMHI